MVGWGSQKGFAALSSEPQVNAEACGDFSVIGFCANSLGAFGENCLRETCHLSVPFSPPPQPPPHAWRKEVGGEELLPQPRCPGLSLVAMCEEATRQVLRDSSPVWRGITEALPSLFILAHCSELLLLMGRREPQPPPCHGGRNSAGSWQPHRAIRDPSIIVEEKTL